MCALYQDEWSKVASVRGGLVAIGLGAALLTPATAHAGRNFYGWLTDTDVMPERGVEVQSWLAEENHDKTDNGRSVTEWGVAPYIGVTDQVELALPVAVEWFGKTGGSAGTALSNFGGELRYRMVTNDPQDRPPFAPLVRFGLRRLVRERDTTEANVGFSGSYEEGRVHALADVNFIGDVNRSDSGFALHAGAGVSIQVVGDVRLGAEAFAEISLKQMKPAIPLAMEPPSTWIIVGPGGSWTHGRFWLSAVYGIGLANIGTAPRVQWGIAF